MTTGAIGTRSTLATNACASNVFLAPSNTCCISDSVLTTAKKDVCGMIDGAEGALDAAMRSANTNSMEEAAVPLIHARLRGCRACTRPSAASMWSLVGGSSVSALPFPFDAMLLASP